MASEIRIPKLGMSAVEMTLVEWMFGDGERVEKGEIIYTVETDKSTTEIEAQVKGKASAQRAGRDALVDEIRGELEGKGRVVIRPSGTEPIVRVMVQHQDARTAQTL
jgi:pyruvate/2-oxoglutarate dehydrogenase complex dihydrolipoamide acyltransferase (E2) component